ncbi:MAG: hypothetical protein NVSMB25_20210 [Thermoleophilaceae bacterium]
MIGTLLCERYRLEDQIGSGGMSTVYRAFDETLERWVAIKLLHVALSHDPLQLERFRREARTVARLSHPHIVTVIDAGEDGGHPFIVLELIEGETLKARVRRLGGLEVIEAVAYSIEIGRALSAAHAERLVHRDVKPQNVLIDQNGSAKVTDFGISRSLEEDGLTATGRVLGTTDYVAPEQALGEGTGEQSDVYSLGVCLYEMLSGEVPFKADNQVAVAMKHIRDPLPDIRRVRPEVSASLAAVVERATAKELRNRYGTAAAMVLDLEQALAVEAARAGHAGGEATTVLGALPPEAARFAPARIRHPRRAFALGAIAAAVLAVTFVALALNTHGRSAGTASAPSAPAPPAEVRLVSAAAYNPGYGPQHDELAREAIAGDPQRGWETESYAAGGGLGSKPGVGLDVVAGSPVAARRLVIHSTTPGASLEVFAQNSVPPNIGGWGAPIATATLSGNTTIPLTTRGVRFRHYLIWITKLPPPFKAKLADVHLFS